MTAISVLLLFFLSVGLFARRQNIWTGLLMIGMIIGMLLYISLS
jgi:hypothetical protein